MADETLPVAEGQFRSYFERWERLEEAKRVASDDLKAFFAEMKGEGYNPKAARVVFRDEVSDQAEAQEFEAICDLYRAALRKPRARPAPAREKTFDNFGSYAEVKGVSGEQTARDTLDRYPVVMAALHSAEPTQEQPVEPDNEIHERPSINAEASPDVGLQAEASQSQDTGVGTLAGHGGRSEGEVASAGLPTIPHSPAVLPGKADKTSEAVAPPASSLVANSKPFNPDCRRAAKGEQCALMHSQASCSACANAAMKARAAA